MVRTAELRRLPIHQLFTNREVTPRWHPQPGPQTAFYNCWADICIYGGSAFSGKLQPLDAKISTPKGWREMGSLRLGDVISDPTTGGHSCVIGLYPQQKQIVYRVTFDDGVSTEVGKEHLWAFKDSGHRQPRPRTKTSIQRTYAQYALGTIPLVDRWNFLRVADTATLGQLLQDGAAPRIPLTEPVLFTMNGRTGSGDMPAYLAGLLLGDGHLPALSITVCEDEIRDYLLDLGFSPQAELHTDGKPKEWTAKGEIRRAVQIWLMNHELRAARSWEKFIPSYVFTAPLEYRLDFVRGLMDSDGYVDAGGHCYFTSVSQLLAKGMQQLIWALGGKVTLREKQPHYTYKDEYKAGRLAYELYIQLPKTSALFRLTRKKERCTDSWKGGHEIMRDVKSIEEIGEKEVQCIRVSSPYGLYLTDDYIVTHNTAAILIEPTKYLSNPNFNCVIFRRTSPQVTNPGGLWDESNKVYPQLGGVPVKGLLEWRFPAGSKVVFRHMEHEQDRFEWSGAQINLVEIDEAFTFTDKQFWFITSRNRSDSGIRPYLRATTNPDPDSWLSDFLAWWIDQETGFPILDRSGVIRWLVRNGEELIWFPQDDYRQAKQCVRDLTNDDRTEPKSVTFIPGRIDDNAIGMRINPEYLSSLHALPYVEKMQLLYGNWKVRPEAGNVFNREHFEVIEAVPRGVVITVRAWDKAGTEGGGKYSAGVKMSLLESGLIIVEDVVRGQWNALNREDVIKTTASQDGAEVVIWQEQEPGSGGKESAEATVRNLAGYTVHSERPTGSKGARANPYAAQCQAHNVKLLRGAWNKAYIDEHHNFDPVKAESGQLVCDQVDAAALAFTKIAGKNFTPRVRRL